MIEDDGHFMKIKARNKHRSCNAQTSALQPDSFPTAVVCAGNFPFFPPGGSPPFSSPPNPPLLLHSLRSSFHLSSTLSSCSCQNTLGRR